MSDCRRPPRALLVVFTIVNVGFVLYWLVTGLRLLPAEWMFKDYDNPILHAWNWSFLPLDMAVSATGLTTLRLARSRRRWERWATVSLVLTSCAGLQAVAFWTIRGDFDPLWWIPNLFLLVYPLVFLPSLLREPSRGAKQDCLYRYAAPKTVRMRHRAGPAQAVETDARITNADSCFMLIGSTRRGATLELGHQRGQYDGHQLEPGGADHQRST